MSSVSFPTISKVYVLSIMSFLGPKKLIKINPTAHLLSSLPLYHFLCHQNILLLLIQRRFQVCFDKAIKSNLRQPEIGFAVFDSKLSKLLKPMHNRGCYQTSKETDFNRLSQNYETNKIYYQSKNINYQHKLPLSDRKMKAFIERRGQSLALATGRREKEFPFRTISCDPIYQTKSTITQSHNILPNTFRRAKPSLKQNAKKKVEKLFSQCQSILPNYQSSIQILQKNKNQQKARENVFTGLSTKIDWHQQGQIVKEQQPSKEVQTEEKKMILRDKLEKYDRNYMKMIQPRKTLISKLNRHQKDLLKDKDKNNIRMTLISPYKR